MFTPADTDNSASRERPWFRQNWKWIAALFLAGLVLSRFTLHLGYVDDDKKQVAAQIEEFHKLMNSLQFDQIYDNADPVLQRSISRQEWLRHMQDTREQYGPFKRTTSSKLNVIMGVPVQIRAAYNSTFERGEATELFNFAREGHRVRLLLYGISPGVTQLTPSGASPKPE